jgi:hypothetical protein
VEHREKLHLKENGKDLFWFWVSEAVPAFPSVKAWLTDCFTAEVFSVLARKLILGS